MQVNKAIIHLIDKEQSSSPSVQRSLELMNIEDMVLALATKLNDAFRKDEKVLKTEFIANPNVFQNKIREYVSSRNDEKFVSFSNDSLTRMVDLLTGNNLATGGYFVYLEYVYRTSNYIGVFIVRDEQELIFKRSHTGSFEINETTVVNTNKLAMAVRVDIDKLNDERYLHFTKRQPHLSQYFFDWIEADLADKSADDTKKLLQLVNTLEIEDFPINPENDLRYTPDEFRNKLYDNIRSSGRIVRLREVSKSFWNDEDFLTNKCEVLGIEMSYEFQAPESTLKRLKKYEISSGKIKLSFSQNDIDTGKVSIGDGENQLIIESSELVRKFNSL